MENPRIPRPDRHLAFLGPCGQGCFVDVAPMGTNAGRPPSGVDNRAVVPDSSPQLSFDKGGVNVGLGFGRLKYALLIICADC